MPTFGQVPKSGCVPLGFSLDHIGPLARSAADCALALEVIAGPDRSDPDCVDAPFNAPPAAADPSGVRIGVVTENQLADDADPGLRPALEAAVAVLAARGAEVRAVRLPLWQEMVTANFVTMMTEAHAYHRSDMASRWDDYFAATRMAVVQGGLLSAADYVQAQRVRRVAQQAVGDLFGEVDLIAAPTVQAGAITFEELGQRAWAAAAAQVPGSTPGLGLYW